MITAVLYSHISRDIPNFRRLGAEAVSRLCEEDWEYFGCDKKDEILRYLRDDPLVHISCVDVAADEGVAVSERLRSANSEMFLVIIADAGVSPLVYIRPTIMASSLLLRPISDDAVRDALYEAVKDQLRRMGSPDDEKSFVLNTHDGRQLIPYSSIRYFESRNKKIYINVGSREYSFYDTMDNIEQRLDAGFLRCHRSFIVAKSRISKVMLSQSIVTLDDGSTIPLSRSYKPALKELGK